MLTTLLRRLKKKLLRTCLVKEKMCKRINNCQTEKALQDIGDQDISDNFVGVFHANHMSRFIDYKTMIFLKKEVSNCHSKH